MNQGHVYGITSWTEVDEVNYYIPGLLHPEPDLDRSDATNTYDMFLEYQQQIRRFVGQPVEGEPARPIHRLSARPDGEVSDVARSCLRFRRDVNDRAVSKIRQLQATLPRLVSAEPELKARVIEAAAADMREFKLGIIADARSYKLILRCEPVRFAIESASPYKVDSLVSLEQVLLTNILDPTRIPVLDPDLIVANVVRNWDPPAIDTSLYFGRSKQHCIIRILAARSGIWVRTSILKFLETRDGPEAPEIDPVQHPLAAAKMYEVLQKIALLNEQRRELQEVQRRLMDEKEMGEATALSWAHRLLQALSSAFKRCNQVDENAECFLVDDLE